MIPPPNRFKRAAFSLIELLAVIAIVGVLAAVLVPSILERVEDGKRAQCASNLRQFGMAAYIYTSNHEGLFPAAFRAESRPGIRYQYAWDFTNVREGGAFRVEPGLLWAGTPDARIHQCPSYAGSANWLVDPNSGYNYNTSYIGAPEDPAHRDTITNPAGTALFGDGEWMGGANKFMRSPRASPKDDGFSGRYAGTQGYRHLGKTNVAFSDGHAATHAERGTTYDGPPSFIAPGTGFLGQDNTLYDLE
jgi:prepilin-type N-terminal cleavage/methylation domain-containing protein/prepilin-type processing-associated H-X9-DG protein